MDNSCSSLQAMKYCRRVRSSTAPSRGCPSSSKFQVLQFPSFLSLDSGSPNILCAICGPQHPEHKPTCGSCFLELLGLHNCRQCNKTFVSSLILRLDTDTLRKCCGTALSSQHVPNQSCPNLQVLQRLAAHSHPYLQDLAEVTGRKEFHLP